MSNSARVAASPVAVAGLASIAGNHATSAYLAIQRCGDIPPERCPCHGHGPEHGHDHDHDDEEEEAWPAVALSVSRQDLDAGVPPDAGPQELAADPAHRSDQTNCVIRLGGCPNTRPGGIPTNEEIASYNTECRTETSYTGPDVTPTDQECVHPPAPGSQPGAAMICSKRLDAPVVGWFANHAYIDDTGQGDCRGKNKVGNYAVQDLVGGNFLNGCAVKTDTSTDPGDYTPNIKPCDPKPGVADVHKCLRDAFNAYTNPSEYSNDPRRSPWGPNSNTFAATLASSCCADATDSGLGWVPGWQHAPAGPCPNPPVAPAQQAGAQQNGVQQDGAQQEGEEPE